MQVSLSRRGKRRFHDFFSFRQALPALANISCIPRPLRPLGDAFVAVQMLGTIRAILISQAFCGFLATRKMATFLTAPSPRPAPMSPGAWPAHFCGGVLIRRSRGLPGVRDRGWAGKGQAGRTSDLGPYSLCDDDVTLPLEVDPAGTRE